MKVVISNGPLTQQLEGEVLFEIFLNFNNHIQSTVETENFFRKARFIYIFIYDPFLPAKARDRVTAEGHFPHLITVPLLHNPVQSILS